MFKPSYVSHPHPASQPAASGIRTKDSQSSKAPRRTLVDITYLDDYLFAVLDVSRRLNPTNLEQKRVRNTFSIDGALPPPTRPPEPISHGISINVLFVSSREIQQCRHRQLTIGPVWRRSSTSVSESTNRPQRTNEKNDKTKPSVRQSRYGGRSCRSSALTSTAEK